MKIVNLNRIKTRMTFGLKILKVTSRIGLYSIGSRGLIDRQRSVVSTIVFVPRHIGCAVTDCRRLTSYSIVIGTVNSVALYTSKGHSSRVRFAIPRITSCVPGIVTNNFRNVVVGVAGPYSIVASLVTGGDNLPGNRIFNANAKLSDSHLIDTVSRRANLSRRSFSTCVVKRRNGSRVIP